MEGRDLPVLILVSNKIKRTKVAGSARQPGVFLYRSKERHQRKDLRCAGHFLCGRVGVFTVLVYEGIREASL